MFLDAYTDSIIHFREVGALISSQDFTVESGFLPKLSQ